MNRSLKLSILVALTLSSTQALALGLGQIRVKSALNKPLVAEIPLHTDYPGEADKLEVSLASADQFARAGLDRMSLTVQLKFKVTTDANGQKVILVTTDQPVRETFLDFLIKVDWPRGELLREYTVLLDPPVMVSPMRMQGAVAPAAPAPAPRPAPAPAPAAAPPPPPPKPRVAETHPLRGSGKAIKEAAPAPKAKAKVATKPKPKPQAKAPAPKPAPAPAAMQGGNYGPVHHGQTLWGIARKTRSSDISVNQMMIALKAANPDAFYKNNINALKSGAVLRIPSHDQLMATSKAAATAAVMRQDNAWQATRPSRPTTLGQAGGGRAHAKASPAAAPAPAGGSKTAASGDHLRLVPPSNGGQSTGARAGVANGSNKVAVQNLRDQLSRAKEALSSSQQQSSDLQAQLKSLKSIQDKNDRLMSLKNAEIAELQNKLGQAGKPAPAASAAGAAMNGKLASAASSANVAQAASAGKPAMASSAAAKAAAKPVAASKPKTPPAKPARHAQAKPWYLTLGSEGGPWYTTLWAKIAAGGVLLLALMLLALRGRGKKKAAAGPSLADQFGDSPLDGSPEGGGADEEQDELLQHLAEHPDDIGSHLELVSLYYARRDVERFESAAEAMHAHISDPDQEEWRDVMTMGEELAPDYPLFAGAQGYEPAIPPEHEEAAPSWEQETQADEPDAAHAEEPAEEPAGMEDFDFNAPPPTTEAPSEDEFDALPPLDAPAETGTEASAPAESGTETAAPAESGTETPVPADELSDLVLEGELDEDLSAPQAEPALDSLPAEDTGEEAPAAAPPAGLGGDAVDTKIDLARAYMDMGDPDGARAMLEEAMAEGSEEQREVAQKLLDELD